MSLHKPAVKISPKISKPSSREVTGHTVVICVTGGESGHHQLQERTWGRVEDDFREVPCGFSRHLLPLTNPLPHILNPHLPSRSPMWQTGSLPGSDDKWMARMHGPEGATWVWPRGSSPLHSPSGGGGVSLDHDTHTDPQSRGCADWLGLCCGGCSICSLWKVSSCVIWQMS